MQQVKKRLKRIKERVKEAALKAGRNPEDIKVVAVSKTHSLDKIKQVSQAGIISFGESRVQELRDKYETMPHLDWHMIGHLQRNKVKYLARMKNCKLIHSVDSLRLAKKIEDRAQKADRQMNVLIQVNIAKDKNKYGLAPEKINDFLTKVATLDYLQVKGLMTLVPYVDDPEEVRPYFRELRELFTEIKARQISGIKMKELSMGMTNDFEIAIEEGATIVRIGRGIFGARDYK
ncbi:pyridoxal phosphate enzyme, YggS family [Halobacteroides halobius DSM 5150]|uniref:Pyridoxal phosphate homeostasis protein n=1 Tax=Halobacteroides halobius (strain ATCC 35273 / DSM 5150 / MD-1) TaxID=748449 RepID=L0K8G1_HALHC|nr:YggS family pyridoxal phosphate-dependent enzyme [Halobacteroides halobius]AGB40815.1 pyridoxal phosphate enzyme, YggS family [Halobacteroides halobius DSM 5150]